MATIATKLTSSDDDLLNKCLDTGLDSTLLNLNIVTY